MKIERKKNKKKKKKKKGKFIYTNIYHHPFN